MKVRKLLLVEDNDQDERLILRSFRKANIGNPMEVVRDGQQALDYIFADGEFAYRDPHDLPAIILLDIGLPRVSGLEVLSRLRADERTRLLPVAILTSSDEERDMLQSYQNGANSFVRKPLDSTEFMQTVASLGLYWLAINDGPAS